MKNVGVLLKKSWDKERCIKEVKQKYPTCKNCRANPCERKRLGNLVKYDAEVLPNYIYCVEEEK